MQEHHFFNQEELDFFMKWQHQAYDPANNEHIAAKKFLMDTVWDKSIYLGQEIVKRVNGFHLDGKKYWSQRGWKANRQGENVQAAIFKPYTWIKVFKNTDKGKDIFFTFGIEAYPQAEAFVYKIDCQDKRDSKLSQYQIALCKSLIPESAKWNEISFEDLLKLDWKKLITICVEFINNYLDYYDAIVNAVWGEAIPAALFKNQLIRREKPEGSYSQLPEVTKTFQEVEVDYECKAKEQKELGNAGEALVKQYEVEFLKKRNCLDKAELVSIVKDGNGYDVYSFDEAGNEKFIEVKTTEGDKSTPFNMSENELAFMRLNQGKYSIYRVYNFDYHNNFGEFFELKNNVESQLLLKPINFRVLVKKIAETLI